MHLFCSMHFFDPIHRLWDNEFFWGFELIFWKCNKTILVNDTLNLIAHYWKEIKFCIFFIRDTFFIWFTVYEILRFFFRCWVNIFFLIPILKISIIICITWKGNCILYCDILLILLKYSLKIHIFPKNVLD